MISLYLYISITYIMAFIGMMHSRSMPFLMFLAAPCTVPITIGFIYADLLKKTFEKSSGK